jgi:hypothetical protein
MLRADKTARIAANAAKESAEVARQSLSYTQRAFVFIKMDGGPVVDAANQALAGFRFFPTAENFGNTPAINWEPYVGGDLFNGEIPDNFGYPAANEGGPLRSAIPPRSKINAGFGHIRKNLVDPIYRREKRFFVWGRAKYNDIFESSPTYHIEYCWEVVLYYQPGSRAHELHRIPKTQPTVRSASSAGQRRSVVARYVIADNRLSG